MYLIKYNYYSILRLLQKVLHQSLRHSSCNSSPNSVKLFKHCDTVDLKSGEKIKFSCPASCRNKCRRSSPTESPTDSLIPSGVPRDVPSLLPSSDCTNEDGFRYKNNSNNKDCATWVSAKPIIRCKIDPRSAEQFFCPATYKKKCKSL
jgi:hypothetical protein